MLIPRLHDQDIPPGLPRASRQELLEAKWEFSCSCELCSAPHSAISSSDSRRKRIAWLRSQIVALFQAPDRSNLLRAMAAARKSLDLLIDEDDDFLAYTTRGEMYEVMARCYWAFGKAEEATWWVREAIEEEERFGFLDSDRSDSGGHERMDGNAVKKSSEEIGELVQQVLRGFDG